MTYSKEYKIGLEMIAKSNFSVKSVKTFMGREGCGVNANIYYKNKKIGHIIDSGNGGCLDISYYNNKNEWTRKNNEVDKFLHTLPKYTYKWDDTSESVVSQFDDEDFWNALVDDYMVLKNFKKTMKKIHLFHDNKVFTFTKANKPSLLDKKYHHNGVNGISFRDILKDEYKGCIILNDISTSKAFDIFKKYAN